MRTPGAALLLGLLPAMLLAAEPIVLADFEGDTYGDWQVAGDAFGAGPSHGALPGQMPVSGYLGQGLVNSFHGGDAATGRLTSPPFKLERKFLTFLIGGGGWAGETCLNLLVDGKIVRTATGTNTKPGGSESLAAAAWDVTEFAGRTATLEIVDTRLGVWGHICVDQLVLSDTYIVPVPAAEAPERTLTLTGDLLLLPVGERADLKPGAETADLAMLEVYVDGQLIHRAHTVHPRRAETALYWAYLNMRQFKGKQARLRLTGRGLTPEHTRELLGRIESSDHLRHLQPVYQEGGRPQFHFSQLQGWNNDPNGMVYADGLYHLSWQSNPLETAFGGWYWGHAVSADLVHWRECPPTLHPNGGKDANRYPGLANAQCFSGGAAVDVQNTLGKQVGAQQTIVAAFTDSPGGDSLAYSTDGGFRYTFMGDINPIIIHPKPDGSKWFGSYGRDPKLLWHEPSKRWVIVAYRMGLVPEAGSGHMAFYTSQDLRHWEFQSMTDKLFPEEKQPEARQDFHECPELLELPVDGDWANKKWVLLDATPKYQVGSFDGKRFTPALKEYRRGIFGGLKAGQCFSNAPDGRAIMMLWVRQGYGPKVPFMCGFTLPLELTLRTADDGVRLYANPVKELESLRERELVSLQDKPLGGADAVSVETQEQLVEVVLSVKTASKTGVLELTCGQTRLFYALANRQLDGAAVHDQDDGRIDFRVYLDRATFEVFAGHGSVYRIGSRRDIAAPVGKIGVVLGGAQGVVESLKVYRLKRIWPDTVDTLTYSAKEVKP